MDGRMRQGGQPGGGGGGGGKRNRGRGGRRPFSSNSSSNSSSSNRNQVLDSNGPSVRIRGNALQIFEKYQQLARDSALSGDRVAAENLLQHAEHFYRIFSASNGGAPRPPQTGEAAPQPSSNGRPPADGSVQVANGEQASPGSANGDASGNVDRDGGDDSDDPPQPN